MRTLILSCLIFLIIAVSSSAVLGGARIKGGNYIVVPKDETIDGDFYAMGQNITIDGNITGDLILFCRSATINGSVGGDIIGFAQRIELRGSTEDDFRGFAEDIIMNGTIGKNVTTFCKSLITGKECSIDQDLIFGCADANLNGNVIGTVYGRAGIIRLSGLVGQNADVSAEKIYISPPAEIRGNVRISGAEIHIDPNAMIYGKVERIPPKKESTKWARPSFYIFKIIWLVAALLIGLVTIKLLPRLTQRIVTEIRSYWKILGIGLISLLFPPIAIVILAITIVGLPLSFLSLCLYLSLLYLSSIFSGIVLGSALVRPGGQRFQVSLSAMVIGLIILHILFMIPYLGFVVRLITLIMGMGMAASGSYKFTREAA